MYDGTVRVRISQSGINLSPYSLSASSTLTQITESLFRRSPPLCDAGIALEDGPFINISLLRV